MITVETLMGQDIDLGVNPTNKTHPSGGTLPGHQVSLSTFSRAGASGTAPTGSWTPGVVPAGGQISTTITVPGAQLSDKVLASFDQLGSSGLLLSAYVSDLNTVTVIIANLTGSPVTLSAGTLSVLAFQHR